MPTQYAGTKRKEIIVVSMKEFAASPDVQKSCTNATEIGVAKVKAAFPFIKDENIVAFKTVLYQQIVKYVYAKYVYDCDGTVINDPEKDLENFKVQGLLALGFNYSDIVRIM